MIGKAARIVMAMRRQVARGGPIRLLLYGQPGVGKSAACGVIVREIACHSSAVSHVSAAQLTADHVRDWMLGTFYASDGWRVYRVEEADAVSPQVEVLLLQFLDKLPARHAALFTSNASLAGITGRFQSRCTAVQVDPPTPTEIETFLRTRWPDLGDAASEIAASCGGDVRAALNDAQMELDTKC
jgi:DNA polymerase III delta prime subunit